MTPSVREQALELLAVATLERLDFDPPCESPKHTAGGEGCEPDMPAAHAWRRVHTCQPWPPILLLCDRLTQWLTAQAQRVLPCSSCGEPLRLAQVIEYLCPLSQVSGSIKS